MTLPYTDLSTKTLDFANQNCTNEDVISTKLDITPAFIMPDNSLYYSTTDHYSRNFYEEIENIFESIRRGILTIDRLLELKSKLVSDYNRFKNNDILAGHIRIYLDIDCFRVCYYNAYEKNVHSDDCRKILLMLLNSKIQVCDYFIDLFNKCSNLYETMKNYPKLKENDYSEKINKLNELKDKYNINVELMKKILIEDNKYGLNNIIKTSFMQDFAVQSIGFDKIESQLTKTITTTKLNPYEYYFNYILMDYNIVSLPRIDFNTNTQLFEEVIPNSYGITSHIEEEYIKELKLIRKSVPLNNRDKYFI